MAYPDIYGKPTKALPDVKGPLNIQHEGDKGAPDNDMVEIEPSGTVSDPMGFLKGIEGGKK
jgi:hypothetical protein